jgi:hypothetical protein
MCRACHERYEAEPLWIPPDEFIRRAAFYMLQAFWEGRLVWRKL